MTTIDTDGRSAVMRLEGEIDAAVAYEPYETAVALFDHEPPADLLVDLSAVTFIDSTGLGTLVRIRELADQNQATVGLTGANEQIRKLLSITGLDQAFDLR